MAIGPVQMLVLGFDEPKFTGKIAAELDRLREHEFVKIVDALVVNKDENGEITALQVTDLREDESLEMGAIAGALIGFGYGGDEESVEAGAELGAEAMARGRPPDPRGGRLVCRGRDPQRHRGSDHPARAPLGDPAPQRDRRSRRDRARRRMDPRQGPDRSRSRSSGRVVSSG